MEYLRFLLLIFVLFLSTCLLCWLLTSHWIFGPIVTITTFFGGIMLISFLGVMITRAYEE